MSDALWAEFDATEAAFIEGDTRVDVLV